MTFYELNSIEFACVVARCRSHNKINQLLEKGDEYNDCDPARIRLEPGHAAVPS